MGEVFELDLVIGRAAGLEAGFRLNAGVEDRGAVLMLDDAAHIAEGLWVV